MQRHSGYTVAIEVMFSMALISLALTVVYCAPVIASQSVQAQETAILSQNISASGHVQPDRQAGVFTGTIVQQGSDLVFRDASGTVYRLDAPQKAEPFKGKSVKVTGELETSISLLHVEAIEAIAA